ncbi:hypothetical protein [Streptomyces sp. NPDC002394]
MPRGPRAGHRPRRLLPCVLATLLATVACTSTGGGPPTPRATASTPAVRAPDRQHPVLAFLRYEKEPDMAVVMADAAGRTWKAADVPPVYSPLAGSRSWPTRLVWSPDADRLAWLDEDDWAETGEIHLLDVRTGRETSRPCPCSGVGFLGEDAVSLSTDGRSLLLFPPDGTARRIALSEHLLPYSKLAAGGADDVVLFSKLTEGPGLGVFRGEGTLAVADRRGKVRQLLPGKGHTILHETRRQPGGPAVAWSNHDSGGVCWGRESVLTHAVTTGGPRRPLPDDAAFRHALVPEARLVTSLDWAGDGLTVTFSALPNCSVMYPERSASYYVHDGRWTYLGSGMLGIAYGADGRVARFDAPVYGKATIDSGPTTGRLTLTTGGERHVLGEGVSLFAFTPAESAAARPPSAPAPQPSEGVTAEDDHGAPLPDAVRVLARNIEAAAAEGDTGRLDALCDPCSTAEHDWIRSAEGPRAVLRAIRTHPRRVDAELVYPGPGSCADAIDREDTCTPQQLRDAAVLGLKPGLGPSYSAAEAVRVPLTLRIEGGTARWTGLAAG